MAAGRGGAAGGLVYHVFLGLPGRPPPRARALQSLGAAGFSISDAPPPPPVAPVASPPRRKKDVSNRSNHKHGKKGRKQRDKDPYGNYVVDDDLNF